MVRSFCGGGVVVEGTLALCDACSWLLLGLFQFLLMKGNPGTTGMSQAALEGRSPVPVSCLSR